MNKKENENPYFSFKAALNLFYNFFTFPANNSWCLAVTLNILSHSYSLLVAQKCLPFIPDINVYYIIKIWNYIYLASFLTVYSLSDVCTLYGLIWSKLLNTRTSNLCRFGYIWTCYMAEVYTFLDYTFQHTQKCLIAMMSWAFQESGVFTHKPQERPV